MKSALRITLKILGWLVAAVVVVAIAVVLLLRLPAVQQAITDKATGYISGKTKSKIEIGRLYIGFPKSIVLEQVFAEDQKHDTLLALERLEVDLDMWGLLDRKLTVNQLWVAGLNTRVRRTLPDSSFNFDFIIQAFGDSDPNTAKTPEDTASKPFAIEVKRVDFQNIKAIYSDEVAGMFTQMRLGKLELTMEDMDLNAMRFKVDRIGLADANGVFEIRKQQPQSEDSGPEMLPVLGLNQLDINKVAFGFHSIPDSSFFDFSIGKLAVAPKEIDLNKQWINLNKAELKDSDIRIRLSEKAETEASVPAAVETSTNSWKAAVASVDFSGNQVSFHVSNAPKIAKGIDYKHLEADSIRLQARNFFYSPSLITGEIADFGLREQCGLQLNQLATRFTYDSTHAELADLLIETPKTRISRYLSATYPSLAALSKDLGNLGLKVDVDQSHISMEDVLLFAPDLIQQPIIRKNEKQTVGLNGHIEGKLGNLRIHSLDAHIGNTTHLSLSGRMNGLPEVSNLWVDLNLPRLSTGRADLNSLLLKEMLPPSIRIPDRLTLSGKAKGSMKNLTARLQLRSSDGAAMAKAQLTEQKSTPTYHITMETNRLRLGRILKQEPMLGELTASFSVNGRGFEPEKLVANAKAKIAKLGLKGYSYQNIALAATANNGVYAARVSTADPNLALELNAGATLRKKDTTAFATLRLGNADFQALGLSKEEIKASLYLDARLQNFNPENLNAKVKLTDLRILKEDRRLGLDSVVALVENEPDRHSVSVESDLLELGYRGNIGPDKVMPVLQQYLAKKVANKVAKGDTGNPNFSLKLAIKPHPILSEGFLPDLKKFSGIAVESRFNRNEEVLHVHTQSKEIQYGTHTLNELSAKMDGVAGRIAYEVALKDAQSGNMRLAQTSLTGSIENQVTRFALRVSQPDTGDRLRIQGEIDQHRPNETWIRLTGDHLTLNNEKWNIDPKNLVRILPNGVNIQRFSLEREGQQIRAQSVGESAASPIDIRFQAFEIGTFSRIIEKDTALVRGLIDGDVHVKKLDPFAFTSNLTIANIVYQDVPVGNLKVEANNLTANRYDAKVMLYGDSNEVVATGFYQNEKVDFEIDIRQLRMKSVEAFASDAIRRCQGHLTGKLKVTGKATEPKINGAVTFKEAGFHLVAINNTLLLRNETIRIDENGIYFQDFTMLDPDRQPLQVNGTVWSRNFSDMRFELDVTTRNFRVLNTNAKDNPAYYGTILLNSLIKIRGDKNLPIVTANAKLLDGSRFTFVVLEGDLKTDRGEGVVVFQDSTQWSALPPKDTVKMKSEFRGIDLSANLEVNKNSVFRVIVDPESGDNLEVSGDATLAFGIDQGGKISLSGSYELSGGHYQASFQKVLKREFLLKPGSRISWSGDPMDGQIDLTAVYKTKASATDLLAAELAGVSESERIAYRKLLNYEVNLKVDGPILKPQLSFSLDMPPEDQMAFGGLVYAKVNVLNTDPNELNKQVFSLLVLNKFLPTGASASPGAASAVTTVARNSVNQMLTDQLNALSGKYVKGAELNFNLQTTEDYVGGAAQENTALQVGLRKELFNSRLSIQVGSSIDIAGGQQQANTGTSNGQTLAGDVVVEYKITEDGRYRLKAFRENQYEGVIDGILYKTGLGISYTRDYNRFRDLFGPVKSMDANQYSTTKRNK